MNLKLLSSKILISILLLLGGIFSTILYSYHQNRNFFVLEHAYNKGSLVGGQFNKELHKNEKFSAYFIAEENNLGIVAVRFENFGRVNSDLVLFTIKEKNSKIWYYSKTYNSKEFAGLSYYPFGFPPINDSEGKTYLFELVSVQGKKGNAVAVSMAPPVIVTRHQFSSILLWRDKKLLLSFIPKKVVSIVSNKNILAFSLLFFLPFLIYVSLITFLKELVLDWSYKTKITLRRSFPYRREVLKYKGKLTILQNEMSVLYKKKGMVGFLRVIFKTVVYDSLFLFYCSIIIVLIDVFFLSETRFIIVIFFALIWVLSIRVVKLDFTISFFMTLVLLTVSALFHLFQLEEFSKKLSSWGYIFLIIGVSHIALKEIGIKQKKVVDLKQLMHLIKRDIAWIAFVITV